MCKVGMWVCMQVCRIGDMGVHTVVQGGHVGVHSVVPGGHVGVQGGHVGVHSRAGRTRGCIPPPQTPPRCAPQAIVYEGQDKNPEMCRVLLTHEIMCRYCGAGAHYGLPCLPPARRVCAN